MSKFSPRVRACCDVITQFMAFVLFCFMTWGCYRHARDIKEWGEVTLDLGLPIFPFVYIASFGCGLLAMVLLLKFLMALSEVVES